MKHCILTNKLKITVKYKNYSFEDVGGSLFWLYILSIDNIFQVYYNNNNKKSILTTSLSLKPYQKLSFKIYFPVAQMTFSGTHLLSSKILYALNARLMSTRSHLHLAFTQHTERFILMVGW